VQQFPLARQAQGLPAPDCDSGICIVVGTRSSTLFQHSTSMRSLLPRRVTCSALSFSAFCCTFRTLLFRAKPL